MPIGRQSISGHAALSKEAQGLYPITITVFQEDGTTPRPNPVVKLTNFNTGDTSTKTGNSNGVVTFVLKDDLTNEFTTGDKIIIEQVRSHSDSEYFITVNGDVTNPTFVQVENDVRTIIKTNTARFRVDRTRHQSGLTFNITQNS